MGWTCSVLYDKKNAYKRVVEECEWKGHLERPWDRWKDIKVDFKK
jgi:hypothetical protein